MSRILVCTLGLLTVGTVLSLGGCGSSTSSDPPAGGGAAGADASPGGDGGSGATGGTTGDGGSGATGGSGGTGNTGGTGGTGGTGNTGGTGGGTGATGGTGGTGTGGTGGAPDCQAGEETCTNGVHQSCASGAFVDDPCAAGSNCDPGTGACALCACTPGAAGPCADDTTAQTCTADCFGYATSDCGVYQACVAGQCIDQICTPGIISCSDSMTWQTCNANGTGFDDGGTCTGKDGCAQGKGCVSLCEISNQRPSSVGCSFFALNMDNFEENRPDAVVVGNISSTLTAAVNLYGSPNGVETLLESNVQIPPMGQHTFMLPTGANDVIESVSLLRKGGAFRVQSDLPVIAYQHSPLEPQATNDASCLIPESTLGSAYVVGSYVDALGGYPSYVNVIASQDNTSVTVTVPVATEGGTGVPALSAHGSTTVVMNRYDTLQIVAPSSDVTGTEIVSSAPVAVFGAVECAQVPAGATYCDHLEEQSIPVRNWGKRYVGAHAPTRSGSERFYWRVLAKETVTVNTDPPQTGFPVTLQKGEYYDFWTQQSFMFDGDKPFAAFQYVSGQNAFGAGTGDPAMITAVPVEQFLSSYVVLTPSGYGLDYIQIIRVSDAEVFVDGVAVPASAYYTIDNYSVADYHVAAGTHAITSASPFGIMGVGYTGVTSYGYPGGFALRDLAN